ncbi:2-oxoacid:acceptor oxidoreductase subunit alpha [Candidatus Woesearchaeota archaeon]|nr:2-oxoacid:acceptor oxidoreductase subunit alpha [Candidatus Woesearchaeota archaeon]
MILINGNLAVVKGAIKSGCGFFGGYPITPASSIMEEIAKDGIKLMQMEDEIASINCAIGASLSGKKAMTATSGPGFSLMQEAVGYAHMIEQPLVIVNVQRVGPATGMPTKPSQGDIMQAKYGSHGDYCPLVFYPNSVSELYEYAIKSFNCAEEAEMPVVLLSDAYLANLYETVNLDIDIGIVNRKLEPVGNGARHYTGLSHQRNSPKPQNPRQYKSFIDRIFKKTYVIAKKHADYEYTGKKDSDTLIVAYGCVSRFLSGLKKKYAFFRPIRMWPFLKKELGKIAKNYKKVVVVEMNNGQYRREVERVIRKRLYFFRVLGGEINIPKISRGIRRIKCKATSLYSK